MNLTFLKLMSGPIAALVRYGVTAGSAYAIGKGLPPDVVAAVGTAIVGAVPAVIGALTSTKAAAVQKVNAIEGVTVVPESEARSAGIAPIGADPTWSNPNAR
jgi:hypothetical protein